MLKVTFLRPIDQFDGTRRFLEELRECLDSDSYSQARIAVAFAKIGPLLRLVPHLTKWKLNNKQIEAVFGIDLLGTSKQALEFALAVFDKVYITYSTSSAIFHPKFYLFYGESHAVCFYGSHNLTVGGTETNLEGGLKLELSRPADESSFQEALSCWTSLLPTACPMTLPLDLPLMENLLREGLIFDENALKTKPSTDTKTEFGVPTKEAGKTHHLFPRSSPKPPSPIPKGVFPSVPKPDSKPLKKSVAAPPLASEALVIQIVPHHNGEVFLSKVALNQNPSFFDFPFSGKTVPKKPGNPSYPQRIPDPIVNITVYDKNGNQTLMKQDFGLNTVYYERKADIRITFTPDLLKAITPSAVMVMQRAERELDYRIDIYNPGSKRYADYLAVCNQTLPSGGKKQPRKMGWL